MSILAKWYFSSTFLLFLGNWIGQIALNWYAFQMNHNAMDLALLNFFRLIPIFLLSLWAGSLADRYCRCKLIKWSVACSCIVTTTLTILVFSIGNVPMFVLYGYAFLRGSLSALETPVRQAVLPDLSTKLPVSKAVSYNAFILNVCRSIGPAVSGFIIALYGSSYAFLLQAVVYGTSLLLSLPLYFKATQLKRVRGLSFTVAKQYLKIHIQGRNIFLTSLVIMATGYSYTTMLPILTDAHFPNNASVFGTAMTISAIGGVIATLVLPHIIDYTKNNHLYFISSIGFGIGLLSLFKANVMTLFIVIFFVGMFGQLARTSNRVFFQNDIEPEHRGKILSVIMMDRGMIPLGAMLMSLVTDWIGITPTFFIMGITTMSIAILGYVVNQKYNGGPLRNETH